MSFFSRWSRREIAAIALVTLFAVALMFSRPAVMGPREAAQCQINLKQMGLAMLQYNRDYDEKYPLAKNWTDALQPYGKPSAEQYQCPSRKDLPFGYAMHAGVAELSMADLSDPSNAILFFDSDAGTPNHTDTGSSLPPSPRHPKGHSIAFLDAHTEFVEKPDLKYGYDPAQIAATRKKYRQQQEEWERQHPRQSFFPSRETMLQKQRESLRQKQRMRRTLTEADQQFVNTGAWPR